jgi:glycosyltransferase involved in cell wall biosynthesis
VENTIYQHAQLLNQLGYQVHVIAGRGEPFHKDVLFHHVPEVDSRHAEVLAVGQELANGQVSARFHALRQILVERLSSLLGQMDVCIVHNATTLHKNLALTAALDELNRMGVTRFISWAHDFAWLDRLYTPDLHPGYPWDLLRTAWPGVRYVVVSMHRQAKLAELLELPLEQIRVITPGVHVPGFLKLEPLTWSLVEHLNLLDADPLILLPARITRRKNIEFAIRITAALGKIMSNTTLVVTGPPGPHNPTNLAYLRSLQELRRKLDVAQQVHFLYEYGQMAEQGGDPEQPLLLPDAAISDLYRLADLLLFPSQREGFGMPVLEAGLARLPVFAADIPPVRESAGDLAHLFSLTDSPDSVARQIAGFLEKDRAYRLRRRVLARFTWHGIVERQIVPLLQEVIDHA